MVRPLSGNTDTDVHCAPLNLYFTKLHASRCGWARSYPTPPAKISLTTTPTHTPGGPHPALHLSARQNL